MWYPTMFVFLSDLVQCPQVHPTFFFFKMHPPLPAMQETQIQFLSQEDILEMEMATHFSIFAWRIPWTEEPGGLQSMGLQRVGHDWVTNTHTHTHTHTHTEFLCFYLLCYLSLLAFLTWTTIKTSTLTSNVIATPCFTLCLPGWSFWGPHLITDLLGLILTHNPSLSSE